MTAVHVKWFSADEVHLLTLHCHFTHRSSDASLSSFWLTVFSDQDCTSVQCSTVQYSHELKHLLYGYHFLTSPYPDQCLCLHLCLFSAGLLTCCPSTDPVPPSSLSPVAARLHARLTCTVASTLSSTPSPPVTSGLRMLTSVWTLPWKLVSAWSGIFFLMYKNYFVYLHSLFPSKGKHRNFLKPGDMALVVTGWRPGSGYTNTMRVVLVPWTSSKDTSLHSSFFVTCNPLRRLQ